MSDEKVLEDLYLRLDSLLMFEAVMLKHLNGSINIIGQTEKSAMEAIFKVCEGIVLTNEEIKKILNKEV